VRGDDARGVQAPAQAGLDDRHLNPVLCERDVGGGGEGLELGDLVAPRTAIRDPLGGAGHRRDRGAERILADRALVELNALLEAHQVW
jgi:hypothetical protein